MPEVLQMPERLMTIEEVAEFLQVKKNTIYKKIQRGQIPYIKMGGLLRFDPQQIEAFVRSQTIEPFRSKN